MEKTLQEAERIMGICNACRYCEGYCAVFPAMTQRLTFSASDLLYLANLCHQCQGCYYACQYAPPHEFAVNVPKTLSELRAASYQHYAWPATLARLYQYNGWYVALISALSMISVLLVAYLLQDPAVLFSTHSGRGAFYQVIPHAVMVIPSGAVFLFALLAMVIACRRFWQDIEQHAASGQQAKSWWQAFKDAATLRYLGGGADLGCNYPTEAFSQQRRFYHHFVLYGFLLCFAATATATIYHYLFDWQAPYAWFSLPVIFGTIGGIGLLIGPVGLLWLKSKSDPMPNDPQQNNMDVAFLILLFLTSLSGLLLLVLRETQLMGVLLIVHLGIVLGFFLLLPYSKFVHGIYRVAALLKYAREQTRGNT